VKTPTFKYLIFINTPDNKPTQWIVLLWQPLRYTGSPSDGPAPRPEIVTLVALQTTN
jgi:hypothetical protein